MAVTVTKSNHFKQIVNKGDNHWDTDTYLLILLAPAFTFDKDTHATYADVSASEIAAGNGYTQKTHAVTIASVTEDDANDRSRVALSAVTVTATGVIPDFSQAVIINDSETDDSVVCHIAIGTTISLTAGLSFVQSAFNYDES